MKSFRLKQKAAEKTSKDSHNGDYDNASVFDVAVNAEFRIRQKKLLSCAMKYE